MQKVEIKNPYAWDNRMYNETAIKRPNKGMQKYGKYKLLADLEFAKMVAKQQYNDRVKNQK